MKFTEKKGKQILKVLDIISDKDVLERENERIIKVLCNNDFHKGLKKMDRPRNDQQSDDAADDEHLPTLTSQNYI